MRRTAIPLLVALFAVAGAAAAAAPPEPGTLTEKKVRSVAPTRILTDVVAAGAGGFAELRYDGPSLRPALLVQAGDSDENSAPDDGMPIAGEPPNELELSREITIPGYNHLDVATAAWRQNDGRPEPTSKALAHFALAAVKAAQGG